MRDWLLISQPLTMKAITQRVAEDHGFALDEILSRKRTIPLARARQEAMHACRLAGRWSYPRIGMFFGRDHSTIIHAVRRIEGERALARQEAA